MKISSYAALMQKKPLEPFQYESKKLGDWDIEVAITHCGICYSDVHLIDNDWGMSTYPLVPGHEIVGTITAVGGKVAGFEKGQRVGIGWQCGACLNCEMCTTGMENLCPEHRDTCVGNFGGFARSIIVDSRFAYDIPESITSEAAGPLLCGGITVYSPLRHYDVKPSHRVGVIGIGGLGHMALQFANAFGCEVTAFSSSPNKEAEAREFGAHRFIPSADPAELQKAAGSLDFIISTIHGDLNWDAYLATLRPNGKLCFVGVPDSAIAFQAFPLLFGQLSVCASVIGGRAMMKEMLGFAARHHIAPQTEVTPMEQVNEAIRKLKENRARYRIVLKN
ncbi:MAG: NAD(P)-dependent alcohol dehydrogenase [candidate division Zixibacteria bacterium]|nr:NAD(P)-dependent alcohol dehydrogenase [candidate division Zixibacteria bacterium]